MSVSLGSGSLALTVRMGFGVYGYEQADVALRELVARLDKAESELATARIRCHHILSTIYDGTSYRDLDVIGQQAAKLRAIERLARLDWDDDGISDVVPVDRVGPAPEGDA